jgi:hypothetical protein
LIGPSSNKIAEHVPDIGHVMKNASNAFYGIRNKDASFAGKNLLENTRIKAFVVHNRTALNEYKTRIGIESDRQKILDKIYVIVTHHCGNHLNCRWTNVCHYKEIKDHHPGWTEKRAQEEYAKDAIRFGGRYMDLSDYGIDRLEKEIKSRFNCKNIDKLAKMACSNSCEAFFGVLTKFAEGKRLNLEGKDLWKNMILLVFCRTGNIERTHKDLSSILGLSATKAKRLQLERKAKSHKRKYDASSSETGKDKRHAAAKHGQLGLTLTPV